MAVGPGADEDLREAVEDMETALTDLRRGLDQLGWIARRIGEQTVLPVADGDAVVVGIRPEHLKVDAGRGGRDPSIGKGVVRSVVSDGVAASVVVAWAGIELYTHLLAGRGLARSLTPGDVVALAARPEHVHLMLRNAPDDTGV